MPKLHGLDSFDRRRPRLGMRRAALIALFVGVPVAVASVVVPSSLAPAPSSISAAASGLIPVSTTTPQKVLASLGINIHENYVDTTYAPGGDTRALVNAVRESGVGWVRIGLKKHPFAYEGNFLDQLHKSGVKVLGIMGAPKSNWDDFQTGESAALVAALTNGVYAGRIDMLEMPNEYDISGSTNWTKDISTFDREYFSALRANPVTRSLPIVGPSVANENSCTALGAFSPYQDSFNVHSYSGTRIPEYPVAFNCRRLALANGLPASQGLVSTEFGWNTSPKDPNQGVPEATAAAYLPRSYLWNFMKGISPSFAYELFDQRPDPKFSDPQMHFGLIGVTGSVSAQSTWVQSPKPAFIALQRLTKILRDESKSGTQSIRVRWAAGADAPDANVLQLVRADGSIDVAIWLPTAATSARADFVTLQLDKTPTGATATDVVSGKVAKSWVNGQRVTVKASGSLIVLRISAG